MIESYLALAPYSGSVRFKLLSMKKPLKLLTTIFEAKIKNRVLEDPTIPQGTLSRGTSMNQLYRFDFDWYRICSTGNYNRAVLNSNGVLIYVSDVDRINNLERTKFVEEGDQTDQNFDKFFKQYATMGVPILVSRSAR